MRKGSWKRLEGRKGWGKLCNYVLVKHTFEEEKVGEQSYVREDRRMGKINDVLKLSSKMC